MTDIKSTEIWHCQWGGCEKIYKRTSSVSINKHKETCEWRPVGWGTPGGGVEGAVGEGGGVLTLGMLQGMLRGEGGAGGVGMLEGILAGAMNATLMQQLGMAGGRAGWQGGAEGGMMRAVSIPVGSQAEGKRLMTTPPPASLEGMGAGLVGPVVPARAVVGGHMRCQSAGLAMPWYSHGGMGGGMAGVRGGWAGFGGDGAVDGAMLNGKYQQQPVKNEMTATFFGGPG